jgi:uncharacterized oxidoreductase
MFRERTIAGIGLAGDGRRTMTPAGNTILITGGGSGIGRELARAFHEAGNKVIVAGRRIEPLRALADAHAGMAALPLDIADAGAIAEFAQRLAAEHPELNVLVNNAGIMKPEDKIDAAVAEAIVATNLLGPIRLTAALLPQLAARPNAAIINVSSALAFVPFAATPTYCASKAALHSWTLSLRHQLGASGVEVIEIIPPAVQTELQPGQSESPYAMPLDAYIAETMALLRRQPTPPEVCEANAETMRSVVDQGRFAQMFGALNG